MSKCIYCISIVIFLISCSVAYASPLTLDSDELKTATVTKNEESQKATRWWEIATGVLSIPIAIIAIPYSLLVVKRTRLESKKIELEILEKETQLSHVKSSQSEEVRQSAQPIIQSRLIQLLFLRALVLYLMLGAWGLVEDGFDLLSSVALITCVKLFPLSTNSTWFMIACLAGNPGLIDEIPSGFYFGAPMALGHSLEDLLPTAT